MPASVPMQSPGARSVLPSLGLSLHLPFGSPRADRQARGCGCGLKKGPDLPLRDGRPRQVCRLLLCPASAMASRALIRDGLSLSLHWVPAGEEEGLAQGKEEEEDPSQWPQSPCDGLCAFLERAA